MSTVLYITAHPLSENESLSLSVGKTFIDAYRAAHPEDQIVHIDLFAEAVPHIDADVLGGWGKLRAGTAFDALTEAEQSKIGRINELTDQFAAADKYVFVSPLWNFSYPPALKAYIDTFCIAGKTFKYTAQGPVGLLEGKKALHIQASGGIYSEGPAASLESGHRNLRDALGLVGVKLDGLFIEGSSQFPDRVEEIKANAAAKAQELAASF